MRRILPFAMLLAASTFIGTLGAAAATMLTAQNGMTLYVFDKDVGGTPTCDDTCAKRWPADAAKSGENMGKGWSTVKRKDSSLQWAYDGKPLYFYSGDKKKGDKTGNGIGGVWHIVNQ